MNNEVEKSLLEHGIGAEDASAVQEYVNESLEAFAADGKLGSLFGMKTFGATDEAVSAVIDIGAQMVKQGLYLRATEFFVGLLQLEPFNPSVHMWLGLCAHKQRLYGNALLFYRQAAALEPDDALLLFYLGEAALLNGEREEGLEALAKGLEKAAGKKELHAHVQRAQKLQDIQKVIDARMQGETSGG